MPATAAPDDRDTFLAALGASELLSEPQMARAAEVVAAAPPTARDAARALVAAGHLTRFQAERLLAGRTDGFSLGPYVVLEQIGSGSKGRVYKARHRTTNRPVAVKVFAPEFTRTPAAREAIRAEVRAAARLNHPNVATAYDVNELAGRFYVVMEYADGPNLAALVADRGPLPPSEACELARQVALGLDHAHAEKLVHRALKPENVLVARPSTSTPEPLVKIADFGFGGPAAVPSVAQTPPPGGWPGGADYLAPEQLNTPPASSYQSDLYALGAVLYFLLTGRPPFPGGTAEEKARRHLWEDPPRIDLVRPAVPPPLAELVHQLLAKNPARRPGSAAAVAERLGAFAAAYDGHVSFELPPAAIGEYSFAAQLSGPLSGPYSVAPVAYPAAAPTPSPNPETAPWNEIAVVGSREPETLEYQPAVPSRRTPSRKRGISPVTMCVLAASVVLLCLAATGVLLKALLR